jgi:hypothetical protein
VVPSLFQEPVSRAWFLMVAESNEIAAFLWNALLKKKKIDVKLIVFLLFQFVVLFALWALLDVGALALQM